MDSKDRLKKLLERIESETGKDAQGIALDMKYSKYYISDMLTPTGKVSEKFLIKLEDHFFGNTKKEDWKTRELINKPTGLTVGDYIDLLREYKDFLKSEFISSMKALTGSGRSSGTQDQSNNPGGGNPAPLPEGKPVSSGKPPKGKRGDFGNPSYSK